MIKARIKEAHRDDIPYLVENSDAKRWPDAAETIERLISIGFAWTGLAQLPNWLPVCMWGIQPLSLLGDTAWLWLIVCDDNVATNPFLFVRHSRAVLDYTMQYYPKITACVEEDNRKARAWLKWLGFRETGSPRPNAPFGSRIIDVMVTTEDVRR